MNPPPHDVPQPVDHPDHDTPPAEPGDGPPEPGRGSARRWLLVPAVLAVLVVGVLGGFIGTGLRDSTPASPTDSSGAAGFARDMQTHHAQAVQMAMVVRDRTGDPAVRTLAYDIALTQQHQIGQMYAWLVQWGLPQTSRSHRTMAWMAASADGHPHEPAPTGPAGSGAAGLMPGMATQERLNALGDLAGRDAEILFLELMISHHRGGVEMAAAVLEHAAPPYVHRLAETMVSGQTAEIAAMQDMLDERVPR